MPFDWIPQPQIPEPTPPFIIPSDAITSKQGLVANTVNLGGTLSYNTSPAVFDVVYEVPALNVVIMNVTSGNVISAPTTNLSIVNVSYVTTVIAAAIANVAPSPGGSGGGLSEMVRAFEMRTDPDQNPAVFCTKVKIIKLDEIVFNDGATSNTGWINMTADITTNGANGVAANGVQNNAWYEVHAIRNRSNGRQGLVFNRARRYEVANSQFRTQLPFNGASEELRMVTVYNSADNTKLGQEFTPSLSGKLTSIEVYMGRHGTVSGSFWFTIETDVSDNASGTILATSRIISANQLGDQGWDQTVPTASIRIMFDTPYDVVAGTKYWLVLQGNTPHHDFADGVVLWSGDSWNGGTPGCKRYNGGTGTWTVEPHYVLGFFTQIWVQPTYVPLANNMPAGYDQRCLLSYVFYNRSSGRPGIKFFVQNNRTIWFGSPIVDGTFGLRITEYGGGVGAYFYPVDVDLTKLVPPVPVSATFQVQTHLGQSDLFTILGQAEDAGMFIDAFNATGEVITPAGSVVSFIRSEATGAPLAVENMELTVDPQMVLMFSTAASALDVGWVTKVRF